MSYKAKEEGGEEARSRGRVEPKTNVCRLYSLDSRRGSGTRPFAQSSLESPSRGVKVQRGGL